jgi:hypothetical protein
LDLGSQNAVQIGKWAPAERAEISDVDTHKSHAWLIHLGSCRSWAKRKRIKLVPRLTPTGIALRGRTMLKFGRGEVLKER